jgi:hypothetical protein
MFFTPPMHGMLASRRQNRIFIHYRRGDDPGFAIVAAKSEIDKIVIRRR